MIIAIGARTTGLLPSRALKLLRMRLLVQGLCSRVASRPVAVEIVLMTTIQGFALRRVVHVYNIAWRVAAQLLRPHRPIVALERTTPTASSSRLSSARLPTFRLEHLSKVNFAKAVTASTAALLLRTHMPVSTLEQAPTPASSPRPRWAISSPIHLQVASAKPHHHSSAHPNPLNPPTYHSQTLRLHHSHHPHAAAVVPLHPQPPSACSTSPPPPPKSRSAPPTHTKARTRSRSS